MTRQAIATIIGVASLIALTRTARADDVVPSTSDAQARQDARSPQAKDAPGDQARTKENPENLRFGPLVGIGFPRPISIEAMVKIQRFVAIGVEYGFLPKLSVSGIQASFKGVAADLRLFPFKNAFFVGIRGGRQWLDASATLDLSGVGIRESLAASTWFINPRIGVLHTFSSGLTVGIDAGVQLPVSPSYERSGPATTAGLAQNTDTDRTLRQVSNAFGTGVTPTIDLLKVGFLF